MSATLSENCQSECRRCHYYRYRADGQKVKRAHAVGGNAEKVAYEEYGALIGGIALAGALTIFLAPGGCRIMCL